MSHSGMVSVCAALVMISPAWAAEPSARDLHAAQCVAALDVSTRDLASQVKDGDDTVRPLLLQRLVAGTAFVGEAYLNGNVDEKQARALADQAMDAQKRLSPQDLDSRQRACAAEGSRLYDASNALQQAVVRHLAKKRMGRLLRPAATAPATAPPTASAGAPLPASG